MKIIISPAKKMMKEDTIGYSSFPCFLNKSEILAEYLSSISFEELKELLVCNDNIAALNYERYRHLDLLKDLSPAILSYDGIQYKYMAPQVFEKSCFEYIDKNLRIISGFYGILKPFDGITPYRLEMQAKLKTNFCKNLYDFWGSDIYNELTRDDDLIINLASSEYSKTVTKYADNKTKIITCVFGEDTDGIIKEKGVYVKMARGETVRFMAENNIERPEDIKNFDRLGFKYSPIHSDDHKYVFLRS